MTAETIPAFLRKAAARLREACEYATEGPWHLADLGLPQKPGVRDRHDHLVASFSYYPDATWTVLAHPGLGPVLADWLEAEADRYDELAATPYGTAGAAFVAGDFGVDVDPAVAAARLILGEAR